MACKYQIFIESTITETLGWLFKKEKEWGEKLILFSSRHLKSKDEFSKAAELPVAPPPVFA